MYLILKMKKSLTEIQTLIADWIRHVRVAEQKNTTRFGKIKYI